MRVADLFSGIGGFSLAMDVFEGLSTVTYCDVDARAQHVLRAQIDAGRLPPAPVHPDVRTLHLEDVDMIMGGSPCTGFSSVGYKQGILNQGSALISEVFRLVEESSPRFVFLENVIAITDYLEYTDICATFGDLGYTVTWTRVRACDIGAPHRRYRWYALCTRRDVQPGSVTLRLKDEYDAVPLYDWIHNVPPRTNAAPGIPHTLRQRLFLLGNTVVPSALRVAFLMLFTGLSIDVETLLTMREFTFARPTELSHNVTPKPPHIGTWDHDTTQYRAVECPSMITRLKRPLTLVIDPTTYSTTKPRMHHSKQNPAPLLTEPATLPFWSTPRCKMGCANYLSRRTLNDLRTQIRFERQTEHRDHYISADFVEYLMGYPCGWTELSHDETP